ncbi:MAG: amidohydrolase [Lutibacter sp.]|nr:amidohydrolase [Lutibacter sp.]
MIRTLLLLLMIPIFSCRPTKPADTLLINARIYTVNESFDQATAIAIKDGRILGLGTDTEILQDFQAEKTIDVEGKTLVPGWIDAHCHFLGLGLQQQKVDVSGTRSFEEVIQKIVAFQKEQNTAYITGRGWDQNDWEVKDYPTKDRLDKLFPDTPVAIHRIDGHALLANQAAIEAAGVTVETPFSGGEILQKNGELTGIFIDQPMTMIESTIPAPSTEETIQALKAAEKICFEHGLTTVSDAGLPRETIELIDRLQQEGQLAIRIYAMVSASDEHIDYYTNRGIIKTDRLNVRSFKIYADGALGSRGAAMKEAYHDQQNHFGAMVTPMSVLEGYAKKIAASDYQLNTHAIGDAANHRVLRTYQQVLGQNPDRRWRIEHAQVVAPEDMALFKTALPSVQPTHATSDMYWATDRVGNQRIKGAYAYKELLKQHGKIALGTDFPIEKVSPFLTFYAAVSRKDLQQYPPEGFQMEQALSREETLKGMTLWAAYANFEEKEKGSIEVGKFADFIILSKDIMEVDTSEIPTIKVVQTYLNGERVY